MMTQAAAIPPQTSEEQKFMRMDAARVLLRSESPLVWLFYGDSITQGVRHTEGFRDYTQLFAERVRFEMGRRTDIVINTAISGQTTQELLEGFDWRVGRIAPDVVFLMSGMVDCGGAKSIPIRQFEENLHALCRRMRDLKAQVVLQTSTPIVPGKVTFREPHLPAYTEVLRHVSGKLALPLIDHDRHWRAQPGGFAAWDAADGYHPNAAGHAAIARNLFLAMDCFDPAAIPFREVTGI